MKVKLIRNNVKIGRMPSVEEISDNIDPAPAPIGKIHVDVYLKLNGVPVWERGGKREFAFANGLEFGSDDEFVELFKRY